MVEEVYRYSDLELYFVTAMWNSVLERMEKRLAEWKHIYLSIGGRLTILREYFVIPTHAANRLEKL
jgi:hypothetical protein